MTKIFIAKLSPATTDDTLRVLFEQYGEVASSKVIIDRETGRSKCYGFVEMTDRQVALNAIETLDGTSFEGYEIATKEALPQEDYKKPGFRKPRPSNNRY